MPFRLFTLLSGAMLLTACAGFPPTASPADGSIGKPGLVSTIPVSGLGHRYLLGKTEVTQAQWKLVRGDAPSRFPDPEGPVSMVNWFESVDFCNRLSALEGLPPAYRIEGTEVQAIEGSTGWRLPTSAEWEWAANGGAPVSRTVFAGSDAIDGVGWTAENAQGTTHPVGQKAPNPLGLYDMSGNVREWCSDQGEDLTAHYIRGGGFILNAKYSRIDYVDDLLSVYHNSDTGLRIARTVR